MPSKTTIDAAETIPKTRIDGQTIMTNITQIVVTMSQRTS